MSLLLLALVTVATGLAAPSPAAAAAPVTVTLIGDLQSELGCSGDWDPSCTATQLAPSTPRPVWQRTVTLPAGSYDWTLVLDGSLAQQTGPQRTLTLATTTQVLFLYDEQTGWAVDSEDDVIATATGNFQSELGCTGDWQPDCWASLLEDTDGDGVGTLTVPLPPGGYSTLVAIDGGLDERYGAGGIRGGGEIGFTVPSGATSTSFRYVEATHVLTVTSDVPDTTAPTLRAARNPVAGPGGWVRGPVTVSFSCTDAGSGVAFLTSPVTVSSEGAGQSVTGTCTDVAGNTSTLSVTGISIDRTPPVVHAAPSAPRYDVDGTVVVTCSATDALSGPPSSSCPRFSAPAATFPPGASMVGRTATDLAGNIGTGTTTVVVTPTAAGLCRLTRAEVTGSAAYPRAGAARTLVDGTVTAACAALTAPVGGTAAQRRAGLVAYQAAVTLLRAQSLLTSAQAASLVGFARAL